MDYLDENLDNRVSLENLEQYYHPRRLVLGMKDSNYSVFDPLVGQSIIHCDASICFDDSTPPSYTDICIGIICFQDMRYHSIPVDIACVRNHFKRVGIDYVSKKAVTQYAEALAIKIAANLYPGCQIVSDCQDAVAISAQYINGVMWQPREYLVVANYIARLRRAEVGSVRLIDTHGRGWCRCDPDDTLDYI
jgi:hypothetical protein